MNKIIKIILSTIGGVNTVIHIFTPMIIATLWLSVAGLYSFGGNLIFYLGLVSTLYRSIKVGGFIDDEELFKRMIGRNKR